ncbi:DUF3883 domain-containing protein [Paenibacillus sp. FSL K6-1230]|uniref:DUF3883 domain-containing protein n=1 Tax=Paenibacillus sp. FSL K6-1230 TaxID=2921603 RepID=UPI0030F5F481
MKKFCDLLWTIRTVLDYENKYQFRMTRSHLLRLLEGSFLGGRKTKAQTVLELLLHLKLIGIDEEHLVFVLPRGKRLTSFGDESGYDLSDKAKKLLTSWYVPASGVISRQWLEYFSVSESGRYLASRSKISRTLQQWTEEMLYLGVAAQSGDLLELSGEHVWIRAYPMEQPTMTLEELMAKLEQQAKSGREAEEFVMHFEKRRLQEMGLVSEANRVECISESLVNAGYDILSFSDSALVHNRFIEVKSVGPDNSFYWSRHELEIAKKLARQYYLYLVKQTDPNEPIVNIIENPYEILSLYAHFEPVQYHVSFIESHREKR